LNNLTIFESPESGQIRTATINNEPYFVGRDVADILSYSNPQKAIRDHVDSEDKTLNESFIVNGTMGVLINESGLICR
jgi:prophage antirepressor-like protein